MACAREMSLALEPEPPGTPPLWGKPERRFGDCVGCGVEAELYHRDACWLCTQTGRAARARRVRQKLASSRKRKRARP